jgi:hypothetical protein
MATNDFSEYYKTINDTELLGILNNPSHYQPAAVEAAKEEFYKRQLSETEIQKDTISPTLFGMSSTEITIRLIAIIFGGIFLHSFIQNLDTSLVAYVRDIHISPIGSIINLLLLMLLAITTIAFWKRKKAGWVILTILVTCYAVVILWELFGLLNLMPYFFGDSDTRLLSPTIYMIRLLFLVAIIYVLCKKDIREVFSITKQKMKMTIGITGLIAFIFLHIFSS